MVRCATACSALVQAACRLRERQEEFKHQEGAVITIQKYWRVSIDCPCMLLPMFGLSCLLLVHSYFV